MIRFILFAASLLLFFPAVAQVAVDFSAANASAEAQREKEPAASSAYAEAWAEFNNQHGLDERDGCYFKAEGELTQVLEINASGRVVGYFANKDNGRSQCWKETYLGIVFPAPPFSPYWHKLVMH